MGDATVIDTVFRDNTNSTPSTNSATDFFKLLGKAKVVNCAFVGGSGTDQPISASLGADVDIVNCTFAGSPGPNLVTALQSQTTVRITNCVSDGSAFSLVAFDGAQATTSTRPRSSSTRPPATTASPPARPGSTSATTRPSSQRAAA
ncbi:MAG: hypothetical protein AAGI53_02720 [Planctomycetota bacterium]